MIVTNKEKLVKFAIQGEIMPAVVERHYLTTWNGTPKLGIGIGGINYNIKVGDEVFRWVNGERAEPGVAVDETGDRWKMAFRNNACIGNEATLMTGEGKGAKGVVIGKHGYLPGGGHHVLCHFQDEDLEKFALGDKVRIKAWGSGLRIKGFDDVRVMSIDPEILEKLEIKEVNDKLEVPTVKVIPHFLLGEGAGGRPPEQSNWAIQTCYPPDIEKYNLKEIRFGDIVLLKDIQSDYGRGYYKGGSSIGIVCCGPSDIAGRGIGVTTFLSSRNDRLKARIEPGANISKYLDIQR